MEFSRIELTVDDALQMLPKRENYAHKGCFGRNFLLCGSIGFTGAAWFASMGALRIGAGLVYLGLPHNIYPILAAKLNEPVLCPFPEQNGMLSSTGLPEIMKKASSMNCILVGCGLGISKDTQEIVKQLLIYSSQPVVIDADAISMLKDDHDILINRTAPTVLTPHEGEFIRLGYTPQPDRIIAAEKAATELGCTIVLKGHRSIITDGHTTYINTTGNPGMATGGSGDVLAGMITGLIGQGLSPLKAAACACCLHGAAGDLSARRLGIYSMLPSDLLEDLPLVMKTKQS